MGRALQRLSTRFVASKTEAGYYADGGGLYLQVGSSRSKSWIFRYTLNGRAREMGLGSVSNIGLADARKSASACRGLLHEGRDPIQVRDAELAAERLVQARAITFRECAAAYIDAHRAGWKNAKHASQWTNTLEAYCGPVFGGLPVAEVDTGYVLKVLEPIWAQKSETASRLRARIENVLDWATVRKYRSGENPARWRGHLDMLLPRLGKKQRVKHHPAMPYGEIGAFMERLRTQPGIAARALEFLVLTAARTAEVIGARPEEFDLNKGVWIVPAERMKSGRPHRVPLSGRALAIVEKQKEGKHIFPGTRGKNPLSNMAMLKLLERMGIDATVHGFRSTFRDWAAECTHYSREVCEMALAHTVGDQTEAAYRRGDLFEKRRRLMADWAEYCSAPAETKIVPLRQAYA